MAEEARTLGFGATFDTVAAQTACGRILSLTCHRSSDANPPHRHVNDYLCVVLSGSFAEQHEGRWQERRAGCYFAHEAGDPHHDQFGADGAVCLNLHFADAELWPGSLAGACSLPARIAAERLAFELAASCCEELVLSSLAAEIMAETGTKKAGAAESGSWLNKVVEAISDEPRRRWSLRELSAIAERHPVHVAQAFRTRAGISLGAFQRLRRLVRLGLALRRGKGSLAMLAVEFGYYDQAHMTSEFRGAFGVSPGRYRRDFH